MTLEPHANGPPWDLIVIGGGVAGLTAANRAAERGRRVLLLEKGESARYLCNTRFSGGAFHIGMRDVHSDPQGLYAAVMESTDGFADPDLLATLVERAPPTLRWMKAQGVRFGRVPAINQQNVLLPLRPNRPGIRWQGRGGDVLVRDFGARFQARGGTLRRAAKADSLIVEGGCVRGVRLAAANGMEQELLAHSVLLADGGYQANPELLAQHITSRPQQLMQRNAGTGCGDGLRMAVAVGAALRGMDSGFYGHLLSREALVKNTLWPFPILDFLASAGIVIDAHGRRFCDETEGGVFAANAVSRLPDPAGAYVVFDESMWQTAGAHRAIPPNPHLVLAGGVVQSASTLENLALQIGVPTETLMTTVTSYHSALANGALAQLQPPRRHGLATARPLQHPPFHAIAAVSGITYTMGGISTDHRARVLRPDGTCIPGLYAAGATTGGLEGGPRSGYVGGLMKSAVFGWLAGDAA